MAFSLKGKDARRLRTEFGINIFDGKQGFTEETFATIIFVAEEAQGMNPGSVDAILDRPLAELATHATQIIKASAPPQPDEGKPSATPGFVSGQN